MLSTFNMLQGRFTRGKPSDIITLIRYSHSTLLNRACRLSLGSLGLLQLAVALVSRTGECPRSLCPCRYRSPFRLSPSRLARIFGKNKGTRREGTSRVPKSGRVQSRCGHSYSMFILRVEMSRYTDDGRCRCFTTIEGKLIVQHIILRDVVRIASTYCSIC